MTKHACDQQWTDASYENNPTLYCATHGGAWPCKAVSS